RHEEALEHARSAVYYGQEHEEIETQAGGAKAFERSGRTGQVGRSRRARLATLAISYYNLAVELEYTHRYKECLRWYDEAVKLARDPDVHNEELVRTFKRSHAGARRKYAPHQPRRLESARRDPAIVESNPVSVRYRKSASIGSSSSTLGVLDTLGNGVSPRHFDSGGANVSPVSHGSGCGSRADHEPSNSDHVHHHHRQAKWPVFDVVEKQRASDERRSEVKSSAQNDVDHNAGYRAEIGPALPYNLPRHQQHQSVSSPEESYRRYHLLHHHQYPTNIRQEAARKKRSWPIGKTCRQRPASGSAAVRAGGGSESMRPAVSRKRPASAEIVGDRDRGSARRVHYDQPSNTPEVTGAPSARELTEEQHKQPRRRGQRRTRETDLIEASTPTEKLRPISGMGAVAAAVEGVRQQQWHPPDSFRRPKSAYPRLQEGRERPGDVTAQDDSSRNHGSSGSRARRIRSLSARALSSPALPLVTPMGTIPRNTDPNDRDHHRLREEDEEAEDLAVAREQQEEREEDEDARARISSSEAMSRKAPVLRGPTGVRLTTMTINTSSSSRRINKGAEGKDYVGTSRAQTNRLVCSASAADVNPARRSKPSTTPEVDTPHEARPDPQTDPPVKNLQSAAGASAKMRKAVHSRRVPTRSSPSRSKEASRCKEGGVRRGKTKPRYQSTLASDNGRDGKLYLLDLHSDGQRPNPSASLLYGVDCEESPCLDNGREGKLYIELDNGRDGKLYLELENDD
ncbi:unnamed protein product, partial [Hapterophycus canaliculatus]